MQSLVFCFWSSYQFHTMDFILTLVLFSCSLLTLAVDVTKVEVKLNDDAILNCHLRNAENEIVSWFSDKERLSQNEKIYKNHGRMLILKPAPDEWNLQIRKVTEEFADVYTCKTFNGTDIAKIALAVGTPPRLDAVASSDTEVTLPEGKDGELHCHVTGNPEPMIQWHRGTEETPIGVYGSNLVIKRVERYATDLYLCRAENKYGNVERWINVTVSLPPEVDVRESEVFAARGEIVVMSCMAQGFPLYGVYWSDLEGRKIYTNYKYIVDSQSAGEGIPATFVNLIIKKAIISIPDYGNYTCVAVGHGPEATKKVWLRPLEDKLKETWISSNKQDGGR